MTEQEEKIREDLEKEFRNYCKPKFRDCELRFQGLCDYCKMRFYRSKAVNLQVKPVKE